MCGSPPGAAGRGSRGWYRRSMTTEERIRAFYAAFNSRAIDATLEAMTADVDWPNGWEGGRIAGRAAVRDYWLRQWEAIDGRVEPVEITPREDGRWTVLVHQVVRSPDGTLLADEHVHHVYAFRDELVERMDIEAVPRAQS
jgi:ketosteroid isomerase-like protein